MRPEKRIGGLPAADPKENPNPEASTITPRLSLVKGKVTENFAHNVAIDIMGVLAGVPVDRAEVIREMTGLLWQDEV